MGTIVKIYSRVIVAMGYTGILQLLFGGKHIYLYGVESFSVFSFLPCVEKQYRTFPVFSFFFFRWQTLFMALKRFCLVLFFPQLKN